jgi:Ser/Thr protein kinase RdoA (MazF antagonist)
MDLCNGHLTIYRKRLDLEDAAFTRIAHEDAIVAVVYRVRRSDGTELILKISDRPHNYFREFFFLNHFSGKLPVPRILGAVEPEKDLQGAILMEYLPGALLKSADLSDPLASTLGSMLARIHLERTSGYGDLIKPEALKEDPSYHYGLKFEEGLRECSHLLPGSLIERCRGYYQDHIHQLGSVDGPCMVHRDFRPGNVLALHGKVKGIIDWASARSSFAEEDFCPMEHNEWTVDPSRKRAFLEGYASLRPVPDYRALMPLLRLCRSVASIGFTVKRGTWNNTSAQFYAVNRQFLDQILS